MYHPPPLRGCPVLAGKKVLLIDRNQSTRDARASVLRDHAENWAKESEHTGLSSPGRSEITA